MTSKFIRAATANLTAKKKTNREQTVSKKGTTSLTDWYIDFTFTTTKISISDMAFEVAEALKEFFASVSLGDSGGSMSLTVPAESAIDAVSKLPDVLTQAAELLGELEVTEVETRSEAAFNQWLKKPAIPDLVGLKEIAGILNVSPQRANALVKQEGFPAPVLTLSAGQFRTRAAVEAWAAKWTRKPGRKPVIDANKTDISVA